jgi:hypothetical protein
VEESRQWLEATASTLAGRKMTVAAAQAQANENPATAEPGAAPVKPVVDLKAAAMTEPAVQAMLDVFPAEIEDVEEI